MSETESTEKKQGDHLFKKGQSGNPNGRPKGSLNFKTKWVKFIEKVAEHNGTTVDEVDEELLEVAYKQIKSGDFRYWKDIQDRVWGTATQHTELTGKDGEPLINAGLSDDAIEKVLKTRYERT